MKTRIIKIALVLFGLTFYAYGQVVKVKKEKLLENNKKLIEETYEYYNEKGQIIRSVTSDFRTNESINFTDYFYNENGQLVKEIFSGLESYLDITKTKCWTDTGIIYIKHFMYNSLGQLTLKKKYNFECNLDTCDIDQYFYQGKLMTKVFRTNDCSLKGQNYNHPIYYKYDTNDSLILELALGPTDTTKIFYSNSYDYSLNKFVRETFRRKDDSLQIDAKIMTKTEYRKDGKKLKVVVLEESQSNENESSEYLFEYYKNGLIKSQTSLSNGRVTSKFIYHYNKQNNIKQLEAYNNSEENKMKLNFCQTYDYEYY